jgi:hypothetical protein
MLEAKWLFPEEEASRHDSRTKMSESEMLSFIVAVAGWPSLTSLSFGLFLVARESTASGAPAS